MKKLLGILVLGLLFCNTAFAKQVTLSCSNIKKELISTHSIIISDNDKTLILDGLEAHKIIKWNKYIILFEATAKTKLQLEIEQTVEEIVGEIDGTQNLNKLDRVTGYFNNTHKCTVVARQKF